MREVKHEPDCPALRCRLCDEKQSWAWHNGKQGVSRNGYLRAPHDFTPGPGTCAYCVLRRTQAELEDISNCIETFSGYVPFVLPHNQAAFREDIEEAVDQVNAALEKIDATLEDKT